MIITIPLHYLNRNKEYLKSIKGKKIFEFCSNTEYFKISNPIHITCNYYHRKSLRQREKEMEREREDCNFIFKLSVVQLFVGTFLLLNNLNVF